MWKKNEVYVTDKPHQRVQSPEYVTTNANNSVIMYMNVKISVNIRMRLSSYMFLLPRTRFSSRTSSTQAYRRLVKFPRLYA